MASDFGDESGEQLFDWMLRVGQDAGEDAMRKTASKLVNALKKTRGDIVGDGEATSESEKPEWARLSLDELNSVEGYETIREILHSRLQEAGVEHGIHHDEKTGRDSLLFPIDDAAKVSDVFDGLIDDAQETCERASDRLAQQREADKENDQEAVGKRDGKDARQASERDGEPLDARCERVRASSAALEHERGRDKGRETGKEAKFREVRTK